MNAVLSVLHHVWDSDMPSEDAVNELDLCTKEELMEFIMWNFDRGKFRDQIELLDRMGQHGTLGERLEKIRNDANL